MIYAGRGLAVTVPGAKVIDQVVYAESSSRKACSDSAALPGSRMTTVSVMFEAGLYADRANGGCGQDIQFRACRPASAGNQAPIGTIKPVSSAIGMNSAGARMPRSGCCQRSGVSTETTDQLVAEMMGWKCRRSWSRSGASLRLDSMCNPPGKLNLHALSAELIRVSALSAGSANAISTLAVRNTLPALNRIGVISLLGSRWAMIAILLIVGEAVNGVDWVDCPVQPIGQYRADPVLGITFDFLAFCGVACESIEAPVLVIA